MTTLANPFSATETTIRVDVAKSSSHQLSLTEIAGDTVFSTPSGFLSWLGSSRGVLSPPLLALSHDFAYIRCWTYLDCSAVQLHSWRLGNELNCVIQISRFQDLNSTQLLLRFRIRAVCDCHLSVLPRHGHRCVGGLKRFFSDQMSVLAQFVVLAKTFVEHGVALALSHVFEFAGLEIAQTDVFHQVPPLFPVTPCFRWLKRAVASRSLT